VLVALRSGARWWARYRSAAFAAEGERLRPANKPDGSSPPERLTFEVNDACHDHLTAIVREEPCLQVDLSHLDAEVARPCRSPVGTERWSVCDSSADRSNTF
jgi:hypothetical protein